MKKKFTLVELLIVIAIIGILVSLLMPSLKKARYKAKLVVCANNMRQIGLTVTTYTTDNDGYYPHRGGTHFRWPRALSNAYNGNDRSLLSEYMDINELFNDPLCPKRVDYAGESTPHRNSVYTPYSMFWSFSWNVSIDGGSRAIRYMKRMGEPQILKSADPDGNGSLVDYEFNVLMSDYNYQITGSSSEASHPWDGAEAHVRDPDTYNDVTSIWKGVYFRPPVTMNFLNNDCSVKMIKSITYDDSRLLKCPRNNYRWNYTSNYILLPVAN